MNNELIRRKGLLLIISSPSGAGKTTLTRKLISDLSDTVLSVSVTTRQKRSNEEDGLHYYFIDDKSFDKMIKEDNLLEHANVFGYNYGTPKDNIVSIFILPPSATELMSRLIKRDQDSFDTIKNRLNAAYDEIKHWNEYDYVIINDNLKESYEELKAIILSERIKITVSNKSKIETHVNKLLEDLSDRLSSS